ILQVSALERAIKRTGLDVDALLGAEDDGRSGKGGPFVAEGSRGHAGNDRTDVAYARLDAKLTRWEALQTLIRRVPLVPPLDTYAINSRFGRRIDPVNGRYAFHEGVDLDASRKSPVFATAAGTVVYAARKGNYGLFVEINHESGLRSGYAHLDEIMVKVGQTVRLGDEIGLLGNTGRSTGAHLHYEVKYRGEPMDPMDFIRAGRGIFQEDGDETIPDDTFNAPIKRPIHRP
ncbi:MAG: M23 family metallopeptidase, partial [Rhodospirillales bacterium]|nr:M23 family metallopeptidase [Rhodospirillales bacterium]